MASNDLERVIADGGGDTAQVLRDVVNQVNIVAAVLRRRIAALEAENVSLKARLDARIGANAPSVTGSRFTGAALQDLLTELAGIGLIEDNTTA
jgi:hypothetical protein